MAVVDNNNAFVTSDAVFTSGTKSSPVKMNGASALALVTPASLGVSAITFEASVDGGATWLPVYTDTGTAVSITVSSSSAGWYDITNVYPASLCGLIRLAVGSSISKTVAVVSRNVA